MAELEQQITEMASEETPESKLEHDQKTIRELEEKFNQALQSQRDLFRIWKENIAFIEGLQWVRSMQSVGMINLQYVAKNRIRVTDNRLLDHARRLHARLCQTRYSPSVTADTNDPGDKMAAKAGQAALKWFEKTKKVQRHKRLAAWWIVVTGQAYLEPYFDPDAGPLTETIQRDEATGQVVTEDATDEAGDPIPEVDESGMAVTAEDGSAVYKQRARKVMERAGEVDFVIRSPFQVYRDPRFQEWEKVRWVFVEETAAREEVIARFKEKFPQIESQLPESRYQAAPWVPDVPPGVQDEVGMPRPTPAIQGVVKIKRYYERPSPTFPNGRHVIYIDGTPIILSEGELGIPDDRDIPLVPIVYLGRPWFLEGKSVIDAGKGLQRLFNRIFSRYAEHLVRLPAGWLMVPVTAGIPKRAFTSETGAIIRYAPGGGKPEFVFPPFQGLAWYDRFLARIESSLEERMALPAAVRGQLPRGARAARSVELLQEAADQVQAPVLEDMAESWSSFYNKVLGLMHDRIKLPRLMAMLGEDKMADIQEFKGDLLPRDWRDRLTVKVETGESLPSTKLMRMELILTLAARHGLFGKQDDPNYVRNLRSALDLDAGFIPSEDDLDVSIAESENLLLLNQQEVTINQYDNDESHIRAHLEYVKRLILAGKKDDAGSFYPHIEQHVQRIQQMSMPQQPGEEQPGGEPGGKQPRQAAVQKMNEPMQDQALGGDEGA